MMIKQYGGTKYLLTVSMREGVCTATFLVKGLTGRREVEALGENRKLISRDGVFSDSFGSYDVHLYKIK